VQVGSVRLCLKNRNTSGNPNSTQFFTKCVRNDQYLVSSAPALSYAKDSGKNACMTDVTGTGPQLTACKSYQRVSMC